MVGIDLRSEEGWNRIEQGLKLIYMALGRTVVDSDKVQVDRKETALVDGHWK